MNKKRWIPKAGRHLYKGSRFTVQGVVGEFSVDESNFNENLGVEQLRVGNRWYTPKNGIYSSQ